MGSRPGHQGAECAESRGWRAHRFLTPPETGLCVQGSESHALIHPYLNVSGRTRFKTKECFWQGISLEIIHNSSPPLALLIKSWLCLVVTWAVLFFKHVKALAILTVVTAIFKSSWAHSYRRFLARKLRHGALGLPLLQVVSAEGDVVQQETLGGLASNNPPVIKKIIIIKLSDLKVILCLVIATDTETMMDSTITLSLSYNLGWGAFP